MARYIDADKLIEELKSLSITVTGFRGGKGYLSEIVKEYKDSILRIVDEQPAADVVPKSEVDNWYHLYHSIKEELKQEKMYHRETDMLCGRYYIESQQAKRQVAREISRDIIEPLWEAYKDSESKETVLLVALICESINAQLNKKYTEGGE